MGTDAYTPTTCPQEKNKPSNTKPVQIHLWSKPAQASQSLVPKATEEQQKCFPASKAHPGTDEELLWSKGVTYTQ